MSHTDNAAATPTEDKAPPSVVSDGRRIDSKTLLGNEGRIIMKHDGQHCLLHQTRAGKLILTK